MEAMKLCVREEGQRSLRERIVGNSDMVYGSTNHCCCGTVHTVRKVAVASVTYFRCSEFLRINNLFGRGGEGKGETYEMLAVG